MPERHQPSPEEIGFHKEESYEGRRQTLKVRILNWLADLGPMVDRISEKRAEDVIEKSKVREYLKDGGVYLDIGTGIGHIVEHLVREDDKKDVKFLALDPLWKPLGRVRERVKTQAEKTGDAEHTLFMKAVGEDLPVKDKSLDGVSLFFVEHHVPPQYEQQIFAEVRRVLKDEGMLFFIEDTPKDDEAKERNGKWCKRLNFESSKEPHFYRSRDEWKAFAKEEGFELVDEVDFSSTGRKSEGTIEHTSFILRKKKEVDDEK